MKNLNTLILACILFSTSWVFAQVDYEIYVSDAGGFNNPPWKVMRFDTNGDNPETLDDSNVAWPQDILFLEDQDIFLVSSLNTGVITRHEIEDGAFIDNFATGIGGPTRMKIGPDGLIYVLQWTGNGTVWRYEQDGTFVDEFTTVGVSQSIGLDWDTSGNLYVSSFGGDSVRKFNSSGADQGLFINSNLIGPTNIEFLDNGDLLVLDWNGNDVKRFDSNGNFIGVFITGLNQPEGIDFYPNGDMLIGDGGNSAVNKYDSNGAFLEVFITSGSGGLIQPNAVIIRDPNLSVADNELNIVFVTPTVGERFTIHSSIISEYESVEIFDLSGKRVETMKLGDTLYWEAGDRAEGIYFVVASNNGSRITQKIVVKKK